MFSHRASSIIWRCHCRATWRGDTACRYLSSPRPKHESRYHADALHASRRAPAVATALSDDVAMPHDIMSKYAYFGLWNEATAMPILPAAQWVYERRADDPYLWRWLGFIAPHGKIAMTVNGNVAVDDDEYAQASTSIVARLRGVWWAPALYLHFDTSS